MSSAYATKSCGPAIEFKAETLSPQGIFHGYGAVFDNLDGNGDVIDPGAFTETLADAQARSTKYLGGNKVLWPLLWQHNDYEPIGAVIGARQDHYGLHISGQLDLNAPRGQQAYSGMKSGCLCGLSIGYATQIAGSGPVKGAPYGSSARHLQKVSCSRCRR
jgi:HK97 family phage prohead protease